jgi:superfamily II DNA/RNA helicase
VVELRNRVAHQISEPLADVIDDEESLENRLGAWLDTGTAQRAATVAALLGERIEGLGRDSKLTAFAALLDRLEAESASSRRICVLTEYVATLFYLAAEIEAHGVPCRLLHGSMTAEDRQGSLELFSHAGGVLAATSATMSEGIVLPEVTDLILYDIPVTNTALQQVLGRFGRFGRRTQLNVYALLPSIDAFGASSDSVQLLREALGSASAEKGG